MKRGYAITTLVTAVALILASVTASAATADEPVAEPSGGDVNAQALPTLTPVPWVAGLSEPTAIGQNPIDQRAYVAEKAGRIRIIRGSTLNAVPYLSIQGRVSTSGERGLLGVAPSPRFRFDRTVYFTYTDHDGALNLARVRSPRLQSDRANPRTLRILLRIPHSDYDNHNGGSITFDRQGLLYLGTGDGGGGGDPLLTAMNLNSMLGKILRIDVNRACGRVPYCIPRSNTYFRSRGNARFVWARGLRNPWKITTDAVGGGIWIGDVGQSQYEEVNTAPPGAQRLNFGWSCREGFVVYNGSQCRYGSGRPPVTTLCHEGDVAGCVPPLIGKSITGGYVYRGATHAGLQGAYVFGDFIEGRIFARGGGVTQQIASLPYVSTFGQLRNRELVAASYSTGTIYRFTS